MTTDDVTVSGTGEIAARVIKVLRSRDRCDDWRSCSSINWDEEQDWTIGCICDAVEKAINLLEAHSQAFAQEAEGWKPIDSAPKDGTPVLVYGPDRTTDGYESLPRIRLSYFRGGFWQSGSFTVYVPTHWMPLPPPPSSPEPQKGAGKG